MKFIKIISNNKLSLISLSLFLYVFLNLLDGERGLISYYEKYNIKNDLINEKKMLTKKLELVEKKNNLLTDNIDLDYLETLYREKFTVGKTNEKIYIGN